MSEIPHGLKTEGTAGIPLTNYDNLGKVAK